MSVCLHVCLILTDTPLRIEQEYHTRRDIYEQRELLGQHEQQYMHRPAPPPQAPAVEPLQTPVEEPWRRAHLDSEDGRQEQHRERAVGVYNPPWRRRIAVDSGPMASVAAEPEPLTSADVNPPQPQSSSDAQTHSAPIDAAPAPSPVHVSPTGDRVAPAELLPQPQPCQAPTADPESAFARDSQVTVATRRPQAALSDRTIAGFHSCNRWADHDNDSDADPVDAAPESSPVHAPHIGEKLLPQPCQAPAVDATSTRARRRQATSATAPCMPSFHSTNRWAYFDSDSDD